MSRFLRMFVRSRVGNTNDIDVSLPEMVENRGKFHVFFQRISILTVDFNTSLVVYLTNVPTLENFALILFVSVFWSEPRSHVWFGCDERFTWLAVLTSAPVFRVTVSILLDLAETLVSLVSSLF